MQRHASNQGRSSSFRRLPGSTGRLYAIAFAGGLIALVIGLVVWVLQDGPTSVDDPALILILTAGGALVITGAMVGRERAAGDRQDDQLSVLRLAARRMKASLTPEAIGRAVVEEMRSVIDYHNARVYLLEPPDELVPIAFEGRVGAYEKVDLEILRTRIGEGFTGWVAQHGSAIRVDDAGSDPRGRSIPGTDDVDESMLVVPMQHDEDLIGVVTLSKLGLRQFDDDDLRLLSIMADQAATAFTGAAHLAEARRLAAELRQMLSMSSALSRSLDPQDVAVLMAEHLARAVGAEQALISDWDRANDRLRTLGSYPAETRASTDDHYPLEGYPLTHRVLRDAVIADVDVDDPAADQAKVRELRAAGMGGLLMMPLVANGEAIGLVELMFRARPSANPQGVTLARTMALEAAMALENARLYEIARDLADRDPLTGFFNHRYLHERLSEEIVRAVRHRHELSVMMLDLDDFKLVNDTFGHVYGDRVLVHVAELVRSTLRASDVATRYGGDEFAVILPETGRNDAARTAERILDAFRASPFAAEGRSAFPVGVSIGIATHPFDGRTATDLIAVADLGLYAAKDAGGGVALPGEGALTAAADGVPTRIAPPRRHLTANVEALLASAVGSGEA